MRKNTKRVIAASIAIIGFATGAQYATEGANALGFGV
jgi:hypothetical protein